MDHTTERKVKRTNREAINAMTNDQFAEFMTHIDCAMCAYYSDPDTEPDYVCAKHHERALAIYNDDHESSTRICIEGLTKWLEQDEAWWLRE